MKTLTVFLCVCLRAKMNDKNEMNRKTYWFRMFLHLKWRNDIEILNSKYSWHTILVFIFLPSINIDWYCSQNLNMSLCVIMAKILLLNNLFCFVYCSFCFTLACQLSCWCLFISLFVSLFLNLSALIERQKNSFNGLSS